MVKCGACKNFLPVTKDPRLAAFGSCAVDESRQYRFLSAPVARECADFLSAALLVPPVPRKIVLRDYQLAAVNALLEGEWRESRRLVEIPTGGGKALCAAETLVRIADIGSRALCLTHVRELVAQDAAAFASLGTDISHGIYCAGLDRRDTRQQVIFASVASVAKRMPELLEAGPFSAVLIDEAHRIPGAAANSLYAQCLSACPDAALFGLTATPFRLDGGHLVGMRTYDGGVLFDAMSYRIGHKDLVESGYLSPYVGLLGAHEIDTDGVRKKGGDFVATDLQESAMDEDLMRGAVAELFRYAKDCRSILVFACGVEHARALGEIIAETEPAVAVVVGATSTDDRDSATQAFKSGTIRVLVNCQVFTTGFDAPNVDCIAMMRPTCSLSLAIQMLGRGARKAPGKTHATILDFAGNIERLDLDKFFDGVEPTLDRAEATKKAEVAKKKKAEQSREWAAKHAGQAWDGGERKTWVPYKVSITVIESRNPKFAGRSGLIVSYQCVEGRATQFLGVEYPGFSRLLASKWFSARGLNMPHSANAAAAIAKRAATPESVEVAQTTGRDGKTYTNVVREHFAAHDAFEGEKVD